MRVIKSPKMEVRCMNCKNNTKIILLLSIGLLLIPGCHKSATAEDISLTAKDVVLNDPFLTTLFYYSKGTITSDVLQSIKDNEISQEERKTKYESCKNLYQSNFTYLADFILDNPNKEETMVNSALIIGLSQLMINNDCISVVFRDNINFPIIKGLLYSGWENFSAIATLEDYIKNKQIIRENYLDNENTNVKLDMILVTGKVESKGYTRPADYNEDVYSLVLRPEAMSGIKVIALAADRESTEIMQEANIGENYRLQCDIFGHKHRIIEEGDSKELVYTIKQCNPLTPERFDIKPDQIESVTNYLNGMKQCKRNELYFDGKCLDLSQNSPELPNPSDSKPPSSSSDESSMLYNTSGSWKIQLHGNIPTSEGQKIALLLNQWNDAMNQHNADAVAKTHTNNARIRGKFYTIEAYRDKEAKAFKKHPDFAQSPVSDVYAAPLQNKKGYYLIFDLTFSQGGKDTRTEIMLVVLHDGVNYKIDYESDISTDRNLIKKMEMENYTLSSSKACTQLAEQILMESPQFRYEYNIPDELLSLGCENNECNIGIGEDGIVVEDYEFDYKSMQFTIRKRFFIDSEYTYTIHPKYTSQIRQLCP